MPACKAMIATLAFTALITIVLYHVGNRSNLPSPYIIPTIASLLTKYILGDWDRGFAWTTSDIAYWGSILATSYATLYFLKWNKA